MYPSMSHRRSASGAKRSASARHGAQPALGLAALACGGLTASLLGCTGAADVPPVPDLSGLEQSYDAPSAELMDAPAVQAAMDSVPELGDLAAAFRATGALVDPIDDASEAAGATSGAGIRVRGTIEVQVRCPGSGSTPVFDAATNGTFTLRLAVQDNSIRGSFGADSEHCISSANVAGTRLPVELDGRLEMDLGGDIRLGQRRARSRILFSLDGDLTVGATVFRNVSARFEGERFEFLVMTARGSVVLFLSDTGIGLRDQDATWYCDADARTCAIR